MLYRHNSITDADRCRRARSLVTRQWDTGEDCRSFYTGDVERVHRERTSGLGPIQGIDLAFQADALDLDRVRRDNSRTASLKWHPGKSPFDGSA